MQLDMKLKLSEVIEARDVHALAYAVKFIRNNVQVKTYLCFESVSSVSENVTPGLAKRTHRWETSPLLQRSIDHC
jgi:hypothetical protein